MRGEPALRGGGGRHPRLHPGGRAGTRFRAQNHIQGAGAAGGGALSFQETNRHVVLPAKVGLDPGLQDGL